MRTLATILLATAPAAAVFPGAGTLCEAFFDEDQALCEFVAQWDPLHESFLLRDGDFTWFDPFGLLDADASPPPPSPSPPPPEDDLGDVGSGTA